MTPPSEAGELRKVVGWCDGALIRPRKPMMRRAYAATRPIWGRRKGRSRLTPPRLRPSVELLMRGILC